VLIEPLYAKMKTGNRESLLDTLLPNAIREFGPEFSRFADCGAGVGETSVIYSALLEKHLLETDNHNFSVVCFEPLPENIYQLKKASQKHAGISVRPVAVSNFNGKSTFSIPSRMSSVENEAWIPGTSFDGHLGQSGSEAIEVDVIRLDEEDSFDFLKLDLQGGELAALHGLGKKLREVKVAYAETQLLSKSDTVNFLRDNGFVCFFDRLQFGFHNSISWIALERLDALGLKISHFNLPAKFGIPFYCVGYFDSSKDPVDTDGNLHANVLNDLTGIGLEYLQTDVLAINSAVASRLLKYL